MKRRRQAAVLVTDADHGIGRATAIALGEAGFQVLAGGQDPGAMGELPRETAPGGIIDTIELDTHDEASCAQALARVQELWGRLHGVVWAGGSVRFGPLEEQADEAFRQIMEANVHVPRRLLQLSTPLLRVQGSGTLICVSSAAGRLALPLSSAFSASRYALEGLCDALRLELSVFGVHVVLVEPGLLRERVGGPDLESMGPRELFGVSEHSPYARMAHSLSDAFHHLIGRAASPEDVAQVIETAMSAETPRPRYAVSRSTAALMWARKVLPDRLVDHRLVKAMRLDD